MITNIIIKVCNDGFKFSNYMLKSHYFGIGQYRFLNSGLVINTTRNKGKWYISLAVGGLCNGIIEKTYFKNFQKMVVFCKKNKLDYSINSHLKTNLKFKNILK